MKDKLIKVIREVPIADKTYPEYVEAVAEKILSQRIFVLPKGVTSAKWELMSSADTKYMAYTDGRVEMIPSKAEVAREIFAEIDKLLKKNELRNYEPCNVESYYSGDLETDLAELKKKYTEEGK